MQNLYSLWIIPSLEIGNPFQEIISDLSSKYHSPNFEPHITLLGEFKGEENEVIEKTNSLVSELKPFPINFTEVSFSTTYFQSVFIRVKASASLMNANLKAKTLFNEENNVFMPHMSLVYGDHTMEKREKITSEIIVPPNTSFLAEKLVLVPTTNDPRDWKHVAELSVK